MLAGLFKRIVVLKGKKSNASLAVMGCHCVSGDGGSYGRQRIVHSLSTVLCRISKNEKGALHLSESTFLLTPRSLLDRISKASE